jgi:hypothetical protein
MKRGFGMKRLPRFGKREKQRPLAQNKGDEAAKKTIVRVQCPVQVKSYSVKLGTHVKLAFVLTRMMFFPVYYLFQSTLS